MFKYFTSLLLVVKAFFKQYGSLSSFAFHGLRSTGVCIFTSLLIFSACQQQSPQAGKNDTDPDIAALNQEIALQPDNHSLYFARAQKLYEKQRVQEAILDMEKAMSIDSLNPDYYHLMSDLYLDYYNSGGAIKMMNRVIGLYPERIPSLLKMAELKFILEDYDGSILKVNEIVRLDPQNAEAYFMLGRNFTALNDPARAIQAFQTAVEMDSKLTDAWIYLGELYEAKKDPKALSYYESAVLSDSSSNQALHAKAFYLQNHGKVREAIDIYRYIIIRDKSYSDAYLNAGLLYMEMDSFPKAYQQFGLMVANAPAQYLGYYYRGIVNEKMGNTKVALDDYESAYRLNPKDPKVGQAVDALKKK